MNVVVMLKEWWRRKRWLHCQADDSSHREKTSAEERRAHHPTGGQSSSCSSLSTYTPQAFGISNQFQFDWHVSVFSTYTFHQCTGSQILWQLLSCLCSPLHYKHSMAPSFPGHWIVPPWWRVVWIKELQAESKISQINCCLDTIHL